MSNQSLKYCCVSRTNLTLKPDPWPLMLRSLTAWGLSTKFSRRASMYWLSLKMFSIVLEFMTLHRP